MPATLSDGCTVEIQSSSAVDVRELIAEVCGTTFLNPTEGIVRSICEQLLSFLPALLIESSGRLVMVNAHELAFAFIIDTLADLLCLADDKPKPSSVVDDHDVNQDQKVQPPSALEDLNVVHGPFLKPGRKAKHIQFPAIANEMISFLQQHGFSAQARRRNNTASSSGVTLAQIRSHLLQTVPGLQEKGISRHTVHCLMQAPRQRRWLLPTIKVSLMQGCLTSRTL